MSVLNYIVQQLVVIWDLLSFVVPFEDGFVDDTVPGFTRTIFKTSCFMLIVGFSVISLVLDFFNGNDDD